MPKAQLNGIALNYQNTQENRTDVVMVHGLAANLAFWYLSVFPYLSRRYMLTAYDLRGHGRSDMPPSGYTIADMANDLHYLLDFLKADRVHLVGHSFGGAVALCYTVLHPERVASLTLADARVRSFQPTQYLKDWPNANLWRRRLKKLAKELEISIYPDEPEMGYYLLEILAQAKLQGKGWNSQLLMQFAPFSLSKMSDRTAERWLKLIQTTSARQDFRSPDGLTLEMIRQVEKPVLAIYGEHSNCLPSCQGLEQTLPNCKVVIVPGAGHFHPMARPAHFAREFTNFLNQVQQ